MSRAKLTSLLTSILLLIASVAFAGGPLIIFDAATQTPWAYAPGVAVYTDLGPLGAVTNAQADVHSANMAAQWTAVPTATFTAAVAGDFASIGLPDITSLNAATVIGPNNGGGIHVIYDSDGLVTQNVLGAPPGVLGIATPEFGAGGVLTESWVVLNGAAVSAGDLPLANSFAGVFTHEFGHAINLAHTQTNGAIIFFGDDRGPTGCALPYTGGVLSIADTETMYPFIDPSAGSVGVQQATVEHPDDTTTLSDIYPAGGWPAGTATIQGQIFDTDGVTPLTGVNVIARNLNDAYADAVSALSGDFTQGSLGADGRYRFTGLTPGADYVIYVDTIVDGGFSTPPVQPLPGPEEWWNIGEDNVSVLDPPCDFTPINVAANQLVTVDIKLNGAGAPPAISVSPASMGFTVPVNGTDSAPLTISNIAVAPAQDLDWTVVDVQPSIAAPIYPTLDPARFSLEKAPRVGLDRNPDTSDPRFQRQCRDCGQSHGKRVIEPIDFIQNGAIANPVTDPSFELGPGGGAWIESSTNFGTPICDTGTCGTGGGTGPRTGAFWTWFGGFSTGTETGSVLQSVVFPAVTGLALEFYLEIPGCDTAADKMEVLIDGTVVFSVDGADVACGAVGYVLQSVDVSAFADGGAHTLRFQSTTVAAGAGATNFFVDDIALVQNLGPCSWMTAAPGNGLTAPGGSSIVTVSVDATGLPVGTYACQLEIASNDPANVLVTVPVRLDVVANNVINVLVSSPANGPVAVYSRPDGLGRTMTQALLWDGIVGNAPIVVDATIGVRLSDGGGAPVVGFPANQITLKSAAGGWIECPNDHLFADGPTDINGFTTISGALFAGGFSGPGELMEVVVNDPNLGTVSYPNGLAGLRYLVNSPDLNRDLVSNLVDVADFSTILAGPTADFAADFVWDGVINLVDVAELSTGIGASCPTPIVAGGNDPKTPIKGEIGIYFDPEGRTSDASLAGGETVSAYVIARGEVVRSGISAFAARVRVSDNLVIVSRENVGAAVDLGRDDNSVVGYASARSADDESGLILMRLELRAKDDQPAQLWIEPAATSAAEVPEVASNGELVGLRPVSGASDVSVASLNSGQGNVSKPVALGMNIAPNPFNPATTLRFALPSSGHVDLRILDVRGALVTVLRSEVFEAGEHQITWNGTDRSGRSVGSGIYYAMLVTDDGSLTKKMLLVK